ncbi:MAG TPA: beta-1,6-N-acetylglucosaminyltransferase [Thermoanaerobaculia bacterium]
MRVAYFVQTHRAPAQVLRLVETLRAGSPEALLLVGHDPSGPPLDGRALAAHGAELFHPAVPPRRGYWSLFAPWVEAVERLERAAVGWDWLVYLSGQDYPVRPLAASEAALAAGGVDGWLTWVDAAGPSPEGRRRQGRLRYLYRYRDLPRARPLLRLLRRANGIQPWWHVHLTYGPRLGRRAGETPFGPRLRPVWGSQWTTLSRDAALAVAEAAHGPLADWFAATVCPDEAFAQTVLVNDPRFRLANDNLRFVDVRGSRDGHPRRLGAADGPMLLAGGYAFARKLDLAAEPTLFDWLDEHAPHRRPRHRPH